VKNRAAQKPKSVTRYRFGNPLGKLEANLDRMLETRRRKPANDRLARHLVRLLRAPLTVILDIAPRAG
jgi:hypothetical protein